MFNLILAGFGVVTLIFGDARDALFLGIIVANSTIGISQEVRAKRARQDDGRARSEQFARLRDGGCGVV